MLLIMACRPGPIEAPRQAAIDVSNCRALRDRLRGVVADLVAIAAAVGLDGS